ncbi:hypothetical protein TKK_0005565 [Trichogramma kaykai]
MKETMSALSNPMEIPKNSNEIQVKEKVKSHQRKIGLSETAPVMSKKRNNQPRNISNSVNDSKKQQPSNEKITSQHSNSSISSCLQKSVNDSKNQQSSNTKSTSQNSNSSISSCFQKSVNDILGSKIVEQSNTENVLKNSAPKGSQKDKLPVQTEMHASSSFNLPLLFESSADSNIGYSGLGLQASSSIDHISNLIIEMFAEVKEIKMDMKGIRQDINIIKTARINGVQNSIAVSSTIQLGEKYHLKIPFETVENFEMFDDELNSNPNLRQDVDSIVELSLDPSFFTKGKKKELNAKVFDKEIRSALSSLMSNVVGWNTNKTETVSIPKKTKTQNKVQRIKDIEKIVAENNSKDEMSEKIGENEDDSTENDYDEDDDNDDDNDGSGVSEDSSNNEFIKSFRGTNE